MTDKLRNMIRELAHDFDKQDEAAFNLWSYLPSQKEAIKYHGDYYAEFQPTITDILIEVTYFLQDKMNPTEEQLKENEFYHCSCGELEYENEDEKKDKNG